jgi:hypothetical protein
MYQWLRQRGKVRVVLRELQDRLYVIVIVDAPNSIQVRSLSYVITGRGRIKRHVRMSWRIGKTFRQRLKSMWEFRSVGLAVAALEPTTPGGRPAWNPVSGRCFPTEIAGYSDDSWILIGSNYSQSFQEYLVRYKSPRIRFTVGVTGHPRRHVRSRWRPVASLSMLAEENAWLLRGDRGLPQPTKDAALRIERPDGLKGIENSSSSH